MKLKKINIANFRCFRSLSFQLHDDVNVFVGVNGAGKTAVLDAIAMVLWDVVAANSSGSKKERVAQRVNLRSSDILVPNAKEDFASERDFVDIRATAADFYDPYLPGESKLTELSWGQYIRFKPPGSFSYDTRTSKRISDIYNYFDNIWKAIAKAPEALIPLPVVAYYRASRRFSSPSDLSNVFTAHLERQNAYHDALNAGASYNMMSQWFYLRENLELRAKLQSTHGVTYELPDLKAVRAAINKMIDNVHRIYFDDTPPRLKVELRSESDTKCLSLEQLSDGYRNLLAIVLDFARRLAQANPNETNPLEAPGILLIDEVELHLHPRWQQTVVPNLREIFPNTQLILTTHSPQVLTTVAGKNIFVIRGQRMLSPGVETFGSESTVPLESVLETDTRPPNNENAIQIAFIYGLISDGKLDEASECLSRLLPDMPQEPALLEAEVIIRNRIWERELGL